MGKLREFEVTLPIAGHAYVMVEAESEEEAIEKAMNDVTLDKVETWEAMLQFNQGNICYCPRPWEAEATDCSEVEEEEVKPE